ncbi:hypothetical protein MC885_020019 [Smutsia gigantea]|nr:hypothetical protein MC885_020019 [Smutsia gigantea]
MPTYSLQKTGLSRDQKCPEEDSSLLWDGNSPTGGTVWRKRPQYQVNTQERYQSPSGPPPTEAAIPRAFWLEDSRLKEAKPSNAKGESTPGGNQLTGPLGNKNPV